MGTVDKIRMDDLLNHKEKIHSARGSRSNRWGRRGQHRRRIWWALMVMALFAVPAPLSARETVDRIVAYVNEDIIVLSELEDEIAPYAERVRQMGYDAEKQNEMLFKLREDMLGRLVEQKLTDQEIEKAGITIGEEEIDQNVERLKQANQMTEEMLTEALKEQGMSLEDYRERIKEQILRSRLVTREVKSKIVVTDEDIKAYFDTHPEAFQGEVMVHLRHLTYSIAPGTSQGQKDAARWEMAGTLKDLEGGTPFQVIEDRFNDQGSGRRGGDLGEFKKQTLSPLIQKAITGLKAGDVTALLETDQGFQIFYLQNIKQTGGKTVEDASAAISETIYKQRVDERFMKWIENLKKTAHIKTVL